MTGRSPRPRSAREQDPELAEISSKIKWLMFFRVVMISVLLGTTMVFNLEELAKLQDPLQLYIIVLILFVYVLTLLYALLLPHLRRLRLFAHVQLTTDVLLSAALVWVTGGTASAFTFIFSLAIVNGATILYRTGALVTATTSAFAFVGLALLEGFTGVGRPPGWSGQLAEEAGGRNLYFLCYVHVASFYLIAVLSSYLSEMLRKADRRIRAQAEDIERMRALNEQIVGSITSGMMISTAGRISFFNRSAERITGLNGAEVLGRPVHELFDGLLLPGGSPPDEAADEPRTEQRTPTPPPVRTRTEDRWQLEFRRPDGESILLGYRVGPLQGQKGQGDGLILFEDVTRLQQLEEAIRRSHRLASVGQLAAGIAHEVRNPLASISGAVQLLSGGEKVSPDERALLEIVQRETDRLERLIASFLSYARPTSRGHRPVGVRELILVTLRMFENDPALGTGITCRVEELEEELWVTGDADQLKQVLWNLLTNAAQAMAGRWGTIRVGAQRRPSAEEQGKSWIEVWVEDEGHGMSEELQAHIFDPFFTTRSTGTGLGLATVHRIVEEHGGVIEVRSSEGQGTRMAFLLKEARPQPLAASVAQS